MDIPSIVSERRQRSDERVRLFESSLRENLGIGYDEAIGDHTCVYVVGSGGRGEFAAKSDIDLFLVRVEDRSKRRIQEIILQAAVIKAMRSCGFEDPSRDANFLKLHDLEMIKSLLGAPGDDLENTFTARMLLILESRLVLGAPAYDKLISAVFFWYGEMRARHPSDFLPFMLMNDIVRYWRIVLLNHESRLREKKEDQQLERRRASYKLRFARCLTCFGTVAYLLALGRRSSNVADADLKEMVTLSPLQRIVGAASMVGSDELAQKIAIAYANFLDNTGLDKTELMGRFADDRNWRAWSEEANQFCDDVARLLAGIGGAAENPMVRRLYRHIMV